MLSSECFSELVGSCGGGEGAVLGIIVVVGGRISRLMYYKQFGNKQ